MSVLNQSGEEQVECPLCMEPLEVDDLHFYPCTCGYQICRFCWNRIREGETGLCPACRKAYPENPADFTPLSQEQVAAIKTEKKAREQKRRNKTLESRKALANVRVVQNNLVFVVGLPVRLADPEVLKRQEYFGKYGKIHKVVINQSTTYAGSQGPSASAYVTYVTSADALRAIQGVNNVTLDGRVLKSSLGTTKYCANFMKNQPCPKPDCMYLHELGDPKASFTKEEMHAGLHQVYERKLHNQLLAATRDKPAEEKSNGTGSSSTSAEKGSSKDGNQSNFIPTTVVTTANINIVNSTSKSNKKDIVNGNGNNSNSNGAGSSAGQKEAWPSLGSSPPGESPARKHSPKPTHSTAKSQENDSPESSSPTQQRQAQTKNKENTESSKTKHKDITNGPANKKSKSDKKKNSNSNSDISETDTTEKQINVTQASSVFDTDSSQNYLSNELDELESDRHSLLENHDLLDNSDHSLFEDDTHNLLNDTNDLMMQRHRDMLAMQKPVVNGYGLLDRDIMNYLGNDRQINQMNQVLIDKEMLLRERSRNEMVMRQKQNEMLARQHNVMGEPKHYLQSSMNTPSIGLDSASELLGTNYHQNSHILPPFGMRVENSLGSSSLGAGSMTSGSMTARGNGSLSGGYLMSSQMMHNHQPMQSQLVNGFDTPQTVSEGRYMAENMDKFFTDFHKAQQMRSLVHPHDDGRFSEQHHRHQQHQHQLFPHNMLSAERLEMEHKHRMNNIRNATSGMGVLGESAGRAAGDGDDDLDFDPFKESQKVLAEMMATEMKHNTVSSGDNLERVRGSRLAPPGFGNVGAFQMQPAASRLTQHQGFNSNNAIYSDWTQMDPAIMSTSVNFGKSLPQQGLQQSLTQQTLNHQTLAQQNLNHQNLNQQSLTQQQQDLFARFNQLGLQPNGVSKPLGPSAPGWAPKLSHGWGAAPYANIPLPPGFAPAKPAQLPTECIDAK